MKDTLRLMSYSLIVWISLSGILFAMPNPDRFEFIFMNELESGMMGEALTVIDGAKIESFTVELIGLARDSGFDNRDFLLCRMSGDVIERSGGIAGGMSGSPVYFSGRLAGAVSGHWSYTDQTIGIVTPIEYMLEEIDYIKSDIHSHNNQTDETAWKTRNNSTAAMSLQEIKIVSSADLITTDNKNVFVSAATPFYISGIDEEDLELINPILNESGNNELFIVPISYPPNVKVPKEFCPGCVVSVPLSRGDISYGGYGTITWVSNDGKYFLGFGHSMGRRGPCEIPVGNGYIYGMLRSKYRSTKLGVALDPIGIVLQDRGDAIAGIIGDVPSYIPVKVSTLGSTLNDRITMRSEVIPSWYEYPNVAVSVVTASISRCLDGDSSGTLNVNTTVKLKINNESKWFRRDDIYSRNNIIAQYRDDLQRILLRIRETDMDYITLEYIDVTVEYRPDRHEARIEGFEILSVEEIKNRADDKNHDNDYHEDAFDDTSNYCNPKLDEDNPQKYILKSGSLYLAAVNLVNYRAPREIVYVPFFLPDVFEEGKGRITIRNGAGEMPSANVVGYDVNTYITKWKKEPGHELIDDIKSVENYLENLFESNRGNVLIFEVVSDKNDSFNNKENTFVRIEIEREGALKGIWESELKVEK